MAKVFVNFRNGDAAYAAALLYHALVRRFGAAAVFRSSESIEPGEEWAETIWAHHRECAVLVAVIGPHWLTVPDRAGRTKLYQDGDWVRDEIAVALREGKLVIPVLLDGVVRFSADQLPPDLAKLACLQSVAFGHRRTQEAISILAKRIAPFVGADAARSQAQDGDRGRSDWLDVWNVPPANPAFVERDGVLPSLREALEKAGGTQPVVLHGGVGFGKTQLAAEYAYRYAGDYRLVWWVSADRPGLVPTRLAALAAAFGTDDGGDLSARLQTVFARLRRPDRDPPGLGESAGDDQYSDFSARAGRDRWLLVFDGAEDPQALAPYLKMVARCGDILITSRTPNWGELSTAHCRIGRFTRTEAVSLLTARLPATAATELDALASALDDLPLAVAQAATFLARSPVGATEFTALLRSRTEELLGRGETYVYPRSLAAAWSLGLDRLRKSADAEDLVAFLSVLAAAPLPFEVVRAVKASESGPTSALADAAGDPLRFDDLVAALQDTGLVEVDRGAFHVHGLLQDFVRNRIGGERLVPVAQAARRALAAVAREDPRNPAGWDWYAALLPHALAVDLGADQPLGESAWCLLDLAHYLVVRADATTARALTAAALQRWNADQDPDTDLVLAASARLAQACFRLGDYPSAVGLDEDVLARRRRLAGEDDPLTLAAAHNLALDRWAAGLDREGAAVRFEEVAGRRRAVLGTDDPDTMRSVHNLALALRAGGDFGRARELDEENHRRLAAALGEDHPDTLRSGYALALDLRALEERESALQLEETTHSRSLDVFGPDHVDTLRTGYSLAVGLWQAGELIRARALAEDVYERRRRVLGDEHIDTACSGLLLATVLEECGETGPAAGIRAAVELRLLGFLRRRAG